jgi:mono/diheme cytochrome c family protein
MRIGLTMSVGVLTWASLALPAAAQGPDGAALYATYCQACHQASGEGAPGIAPSLAGTLSKRVATPAGQALVTQILLSGLTGPITSQGQRFNGNMPPFAALSDADLAAIASHVLGTFNSSDVRLPPEAFTGARQHTVAAGALRKTREQVLAQTGE